MLLLQHEFGIEHKDGENEARTSTLCEYGDRKGPPTIAELGGVPCAVARTTVLDGRVYCSAVSAPYRMDFIMASTEVLPTRVKHY